MLKLTESLAPKAELSPLNKYKTGVFAYLSSTREKQPVRGRGNTKY